jgi:hypothetical protein
MAKGRMNLKLLAFLKVKSQREAIQLRLVEEIELGLELSSLREISRLGKDLEKIKTVLAYKELQITINSIKFQDSVIQ